MVRFKDNQGKLYLLKIEKPPMLVGPSMKKFSDYKLENYFNT